jgi:hypothetical protein
MLRLDGKSNMHAAEALDYSVSATLVSTPKIGFQPEMTTTSLPKAVDNFASSKNAAETTRDFRVSLKYDEVVDNKARSNDKK